jgi:hypothetical protein
MLDQTRGDLAVGCEIIDRGLLRRRSRRDAASTALERTARN